MFNQVALRRELNYLVRLHARPEIAEALIRGSATVADLERAMRNQPQIAWTGGMTAAELITMARSLLNQPHRAVGDAVEDGSAETAQLFT